MAETAGQPGRRLLFTTTSPHGQARRLVRALEEQGVEVTLARGAREAAQQLESQSFDLILCDVAHESESSLEVPRALRTLDPRVPIVLLGGAEPPVREAAELGAFCLKEPVPLESLVRMVTRRIPGRWPARRSAGARAQLAATDAVTATVAKNQFGRVLGAAVQGGRVVITKHEAPTAVLISFDEYLELTGADTPDLDGLSREFDDLLARMQEPGVREAGEALFRASPSDLAEASVAQARREAQTPERG